MPFDDSFYSDYCVLNSIISDYISMACPTTQSSQHRNTRLQMIFYHIETENGERDRGSCRKYTYIGNQYISGQPFRSESWQFYMGEYFRREIQNDKERVIEIYNDDCTDIQCLYIRRSSNNELCSDGKINFANSPDRQYFLQKPWLSHSTIFLPVVLDYWSTTSFGRFRIIFSQ